MFLTEHYSHIRLDTKRQALDALNEQRCRKQPDTEANRNEEDDAGDTVTSQFDFERIGGSR